MTAICVVLSLVRSGTALSLAAGPSNALQTSCAVMC
jgi:hypothetical protein